MDATPIIVNIDAPGSNQLLVNLDSEQTSPDLAFIRMEGRNRSLRFAKRTGDPARPFTDAVIDPGSVVSMAIGAPDEPPTGGTWGLSYNGDGTGLDDLAYDISAADLGAALNAQIYIAGAGGVTVTAAGDGAYVITFNQANPILEFAEFSNVLVPPSLVTFTTIQEGASVVQAIILVTLRQKYLAYSNDFAPSTVGSIVADHVQTGSNIQPDIYRVAISGAVNGGAWLLSSTQAQKFRLSPAANTAGGGAARWTITGFNGLTIGGVGGTYFDIEDAAGPVRFWYNVNGSSTPPTTPFGGRLSPIAITSPNPGPNPDDIYIWGQTNAAIDGDTSSTTFNVTTGADFETFVTAKQSGFRSTYSGGTSTLTVILDAGTGTDGPYQSTYVLIPDANGLVALWFNIGSRGTIPTEAAAATRAIEIAVTNGQSASSIVDSIVVATTGDGAWTVTDGGSYAEFTAISAGPRVLPQAGSAPVGVAQTVAGQTLTASFPFNATQGQIQSFIGLAYTVTKNGSNSWDLVGVANGASAIIDVDGDGLSYATSWGGTFVLSTVNLFLLFAASGGEPITSKLEIQIVEPGGQPAKVYQSNCEIRANVIDANNLVTPGIPVASNTVAFNQNIVGYTGGGSTNLDGVTTLGVTVGRVQSFVHATDGFRVFQLLAGTTAESSPNTIRPDDYAGGTNEKYWQAAL